MPEELSGNALVQSCAEKVMGWSRHKNVGIPVVYPAFVSSPMYDGVLVSHGVQDPAREWNPLASMDDAFEIIEAVEARTGYIMGLMHYPKTWECSFWNIGVDDPNVEHECDNRYEAICRASLKAIECQPK